jgi:hypothetical protein
VKGRSLVIIIVVFVFLIFTAGFFFITEEGSLHSGKISGRESLALEEETRQTRQCPASHFGGFGFSRACLGTDECHGTKQIYS